MNGILITDNTKSIRFDVFDYQFEFKRTMDEFDANWLTVIIEYSDNSVKQTYMDSCILTYELEDTIKEIDLIIDNKKTELVSEFMEPYLNFSVIRAKDIFTFQISFVYSTLEDDKKEHIVSQEFNLNEIININNILKEYLNKFPYRIVNQ